MAEYMTAPNNYRLSVFIDFHELVSTIVIIIVLYVPPGKTVPVFHLKLPVATI